MVNGSWKTWGVLTALGAALLAASLYWGASRLERSPQDLPAGVSETSRTERPWFRDMTARSGVAFTYRNGQEANHYAILESLGGGVALIDYDGDGRLDVFLTGGGYFAGPDKKQIRGHPCRLYRSLGDWKFEDVTREAGLDGIDFYSHGAAVADYDRDGRPDLLVTGYGRIALFRNSRDEQGRARFVEVTKETGLLGEHFWASSAGWGDLDGDGYPDLYVCQYVDWSFARNPFCEGYGPDIPRDVCPPREFDARPHALYRNNQGRSFTNVTKEAGLHAERRDQDYAQLDFLSPTDRERLREADRDRDFGKGLGVVLADLNEDGRPDIYVANDTTDKFLYINLSRPGKIQLEDQAVRLGAARDESGAPNGSMGVDAGDYDGSGRASLLVTNYQNELHALYRSLGVGSRLQFRFDSQAAGLAGLGRQYVGFGAGFLDIDNDGWQDIVIVNGHVIRHPSGSQVRQRPMLLRSQGRPGGADVRFADVGESAGDYFQTVHQGRGLAIGDLDNDGRPDLVISHLNEPVTLLRNEAAGQHWLGIVLVGKEHGDVVGAKLSLEANGRRLTRFARGGGSYLSSGDRRHLFGLGDTPQVGRLTVTWPGGKVESWDHLEVDRYWQITAGVEPRPFPAP